MQYDYEIGLRALANMQARTGRSFKLGALEGSRVRQRLSLLKQPNEQGADALWNNLGYAPTAPETLDPA